MNVIETLIAFFVSAGLSIVMGFIMWKTDHVPGNAAKAAEELAKQMYEIAHSIDLENTIETKPSPPTTASCVASASHKRCAYCDCTNDHIYGTCDYCGAPLGEV